MAFLTTGKCADCGVEFDYYYQRFKPVEHRCVACEEKKAKAAKQDYFDGLDLLSLEKRVRKLEEEAYDARLLLKAAKCEDKYSSFNMG